VKSKSRANLPENLEHRVAMYAMAASAAGIGLLASPPAFAKIVYTKTHQELPVNKPLPVDLNHDGITDFLLSFGAGSEGGFGFSVRPQHKNLIVGYARNFSSRYGWASALRPGVDVGTNQRFGAYQIMAFGRCGSEAKGGSSSCGGSGPWNNVQNRYLGFEFFIKGKVHYGWARLNVTIGKTVGAVLTGYAYETVKNKALVTGKTKGSDAMAGPGTLGHLARGAAANFAIREAVSAHDAGDGSR
jgi:hypothetical protein